MVTKIFFSFILLWLLLFSDTTIWAAALKLAHDGSIRIYAYHVDEFASIQYLDENGQWIESAWQKINHILRSRGDNEVTDMDKRLIELADHLQDHYGIDTIEVISGYRSPEFNKSLKEEGHNVADESYHTKGMACDIHIDEIKESTIRDYLLSLKLGGVGYYGDRLMVHMDFGPVREWQGGQYRENTGVGIFNKKSKATIRTDKLFYGLDDKINLALTGLKQGTELTVQKFNRGKWLVDTGARFNLSSPTGEGIHVKNLMQSLKNLSTYGKFRFQFKNNGDWQNSNEFYIKK